MKIDQSHERRLLSLLVGASAAMIALTTIALTLSISGNDRHVIDGSKLIILLLGVSSAATLLVMSTLHAHLRKLYASLSESRSNAWQDARTDPLTGLGNRKMLLEELRVHLADEEKRRSHALFFLDLDHFKRVNDTLGHHVGDGLIQAVAKRLTNCAPGAIVTRLGGDEFALLIPTTNSAQTSRMGNHIVRALSGKYMIDEAPIVVGVSVGASHLRDVFDLSTVMRQADIAMYEAKRRGGGFAQFDDRMSQLIENRGNIERRLIEVMESETEQLRFGAEPEILTTKFQAIFDRDHNIVAAEALLRWHDIETGEVSPQDIVSIAEEAHLIGDLGRLLARTAMHGVAQIPDLPLCLNVSPIELMDPAYAARLEAIAIEAGIEPRRVQIEISERSLMEHGDAVAKTLALLRQTGFQLSVDDFGASVASITHLSRHDVSVVKLDHSLLESAGTSGNVAVLKALADLVKSHGLTVVCEGIASVEDESLAVAAGCDLLQGFKYAQPVPLSCLIAMVERQKRSAGDIFRPRLIA